MSATWSRCRCRPPAARRLEPAGDHRVAGQEDDRHALGASDGGIGGAAAGRTMMRRRFTSSSTSAGSSASVALGVAILDDEIPALDQAEFTQAFAVIADEWMLADTQPTELDGCLLRPRATARPPG
jgi:hypothetical protein